MLFYAIVVAIVGVVLHRYATDPGLRKAGLVLIGASAVFLLVYVLLLPLGDLDCGFGPPRRLFVYDPDGGRSWYHILLGDFLSPMAC